MSKKMLLIGGSILLLALLGGGIYMYTAGTKTTKQPSPTVKTEQQTTVPTTQKVSPVEVPEKTNIADPTNIAFTTYTNEEEGISIDYPSDWNVAPGTSPTVVVFASSLQNANDSYQETVSVAVQDISASDLSLDEFSTQATNALSQYMENLQIMKQNNTELDGEPAKAILFSGTYPATDYLSETYQIYMVYDGYVYIITYTGVPDDIENLMPIVEKMVASFSF